VDLPVTQRLTTKYPTRAHKKTVSAAR
jgi:hypothetical protein